MRRAATLLILMVAAVALAASVQPRRWVKTQRTDGTGAAPAAACAMDAGVKSDLGLVLDGVTTINVCVAANGDTTPTQKTITSGTLRAWYYDPNPLGDGDGGAWHREPLNDLTIQVSGLARTCWSVPTAPSATALYGCGYWSLDTFVLSGSTNDAGVIVSAAGTR